MAVKYKMDENARYRLNRRAVAGRESVGRPREIAEGDFETAARDAVSDILTALFGPAGYCVEREGRDGDGRERIGYEVVLDSEREALASAFLGLCQESWEGDAEDYTATVVTVEDEPKTRRITLEISEEELEERLANDGVLNADDATVQGYLRDFGSIVAE